MTKNDLRIKIEFSKKDNLPYVKVEMNSHRMGYLSAIYNIAKDYFSETNPKTNEGRLEIKVIDKHSKP